LDGVFIEPMSKLKLSDAYLSLLFRLELRPDTYTFSPSNRLICLKEWQWALVIAQDATKGEWTFLYPFDKQMFDSGVLQGREKLALTARECGLLDVKGFALCNKTQDDGLTTCLFRDLLEKEQDELTRPTPPLPPPVERKHQKNPKPKPKPKKRKKTKQEEKKKEELRHRCDVEKCSEPARKYKSTNPTKTVEWLCDTHAEEKRDTGNVQADLECQAEAEDDDYKEETHQQEDTGRVAADLLSPPEQKEDGQQEEEAEKDEEEEEAKAFLSLNRSKRKSKRKRKTQTKEKPLQFEPVHVRHHPPPPSPAPRCEVMDCKEPALCCKWTDPTRSLSQLAETHWLCKAHAEAKLATGIEERQLRAEAAYKKTFSAPEYDEEADDSYEFAAF